MIAVCLEGAAQQQRRVAQLHEIQTDEPDLDHRESENNHSDARADLMVGSHRPRHDRDGDERQPNEGGPGAQK